MLDAPGELLAGEAEGHGEPAAFGGIGAAQLVHAGLEGLPPHRLAPGGPLDLFDLLLLPPDLLLHLAEVGVHLLDLAGEAVAGEPGQLEPRHEFGDLALEEFQFPVEVLQFLLLEGLLGLGLVEAADLVVQLHHLGIDGQHPFGAVLLHPGLFVRVLPRLDQFLAPAAGGGGPLEDAPDLLQDEGVADEGLEDLAVPLLDGLGDGDLPVPVEEAHGPHLLEVEADGVGGVVPRVGGRLLLGLLGQLAPQDGLGLLLVLADGDLVVLQHQEDILEQFLLQLDVLGQVLVDLVVEEEPLVPPQLDEKLYLVALFKYQTVLLYPLSPRWRSRMARRSSLFRRNSTGTSSGGAWAICCWMRADSFRRNLNWRTLQ